MKKEIIENNIHDSIDRMLAIVDGISLSKGVIPQIDIDLLLESIRNLYQDVIYLNNYNSTLINNGVNAILPKNEMVVSKQNEKNGLESNSKINTQTTTVAAEQENFVKEDIATIEKEKVVQGIDLLFEESQLPKEEKNTVVTPQSKKVVPSETKTEKLQPVTDTKDDVKNTTENIFKDSETSHQSIADKLEKKGKSLNDMLKNDAKQNELNQSMNLSPISNLKTAIAINDKFMFVNDLFKGDMKNYDFFIKKINELENLDDALEMYFDKLIEMENAAENIASKKLEIYIRRRFK